MYKNLDLVNLIDTLRTENETEEGWLEFKSNYLHPEDFAKDISALSNSAALKELPFAYLVFGIHDKNHEVIGTTFNYKKEKKGNEDLESWLNRVITPNINFKFYDIEYSNTLKVVLIEIPAAYREPTRHSGESYIRIGSYTKNLKGFPEVERELWATFSDLKYEERDSKIQDLTFDYLASKLKGLGKSLNNNDLATLRLLGTNGKYNNLALLLSDQNPIIVKLAYYKNEKLDFRVKKEFEGSWIKILDDALNYCELYNDTSARLLKGQFQRTEVKSYPDPSIREMLVNAFSHLDINAPSNIKIEFYPSRVEIGSPGTLYKTTLPSIMSGRQSFRNPNLVFVLNKLGYIENYATGIKKTIEAYEGYEQKPEFIYLDYFFLVKLPNLNYYIFDEEADTINDTINDTTNDTINRLSEEVLNSLSSNAQEVIQQILLNPKITRKSLIELTKISDSSVSRAIRELKTQGIIEDKTSNKNGSWIIHIK